MGHRWDWRNLEKETDGEGNEHLLLLSVIAIPIN